MITKEGYIKKIEYEKERVTKFVIDSIRTHIETCAQGKPIVEEYEMTAYQSKYFDRKALTEFSKEYPFLVFDTFENLILWGLRPEGKK